MSLVHIFRLRYPGVLGFWQVDFDCAVADDPEESPTQPRTPRQCGAPTREERLATAQQTYEKKLRVLSAAGLDDIELKTAHEKAKQQYLRELDEVMR